ncbi:MAG: acyl-CoA dehydrogenase, partial [Bacillota bacterium]
MTDFFLLDDMFTPEEREVRDMTRRFVEEHIIPVAGDLWEEGRFPEEWPRLFGEQGLLGANLPEEYGGAGISNVAYGLIMQELEAGDSGVRSFASVQGALVMYPIFRYGSEDQKKHWLPRLAKGEAVGCFGLTETSAGSDPAAMGTRARRENGRWVLNGTKMWITNGNMADVAVIWARDEDGDYRGFLVETDTPGFQAVEITHKMSMRLSNTSQLFLDNVVVSDDHRLPDGVGLRAPLSCLTQARYGIAWGAIGAARASYEEALDYAQQRVAFGQPLAAHQLMREGRPDLPT